MITPIDWTKLNSPAFTKLTTITVVADEDCMSAVISTCQHTHDTVFGHCRQDRPELISCKFLQSFAHNFHTIKEKG